MNGYLYEVNTQADRQTKYALSQSYLGDTFLNVASGKTLNFQEANTNSLMELTGSSVHCHKPLTILGDGSNAVGKLVLKCSNNSHGVTIESPAHSAYTGSYTLTLPTSAGTNGQVLQTDGSGNLSWVDLPSGGGVGGGAQHNNFISCNKHL